MAKGNLVRQMKLKFDFSNMYSHILKNVLSFNTKTLNSFNVVTISCFLGVDLD